ncbi:MAG TPA: NFACT RNA binding domain-containing protein [Acidobacteriota bacterium]|nr:NFACT RNA binding domain-containing protein [Acidobacteriota bacterium]
MLSLRELKRAALAVSDNFSGAFVRRVAQPAGHEFVMTLEKAGEKFNLFFSTSREGARIALDDTTMPASLPGSFYQYAHAHLVGCVLAGVEAAGHNRQVGLALVSKSASFMLVFSILGARSNLYLLDEGAMLLHALRPLDETRQELAFGAPWADPGGAVRFEGDDRWAEAPDAGYLREIQRHYRRREQAYEIEVLGRRIESAIKKERSYLERKAVNLQEDLAGMRQAETHRKKGELLKNALHLIRKGDETVEVADYETGDTVEIALDRKLTPAENMEDYFSRYQKESRGAAVIPRQLEEVNRAVRELDQIEQRLHQALQSETPDLENIESLAAEPAMRRLLGRYAPRQKAPKAQKAPAKTSAKMPGKKDIPNRLTPKRYMTKDGLEIWVGRSDEGNDLLTTRLARGNDLFFHLEGYPGSHVVLRTEGNPDPPQASLLAACELAVHFSKMKNAGSADVCMSHIKNVRKPKGAKPGLVYVRGEKTIRLRRDAGRLQEILASRLE